MTRTALGIDISKDKFDAALLIKDKFKTKAFSNTEKGFLALTKWFQKYKPFDLHICMEATGIYGEKLATFLFENNVRVSVVNPARIKGFGQCELSRNKSDKADAKLIARFCKSMNPKSWEPPPAHIQELRGWVKRLDALNAMKQQENNRLESTEGDVLATVTEHIRFLEEEIDKAKLVVKNLVATNEDLCQKKELLESIPGVGEATIAVVLAYIGQPELFNSAKQMAAFVGLNPKQRQSGSSVNGRTRLSKTGNSAIRKALYMPAIVASRHNPVIKRFCDNLTDAGKTKMVVIGASMRKLVHIIYGVLKNQCPFNPKLHF
jgi:transposase